MPKLAITMSKELLADIEAIAERDSPGAPNKSATALRLLARGVAEEKAQRPLEQPPPEPKMTGRMPQGGGV